MVTSNAEKEHIKNYYLLKSSSNITTKMNEVQKVVRNSRCVSCNHSEKTHLMQNLGQCAKKVGLMPLKHQIVGNRKTYEQIISRLTELVCPGVSE